MKDISIRCECGDPGHTLHFIFDEEEQEIYTEILLKNFRSFPKTLWVALRYVLGLKNKYGFFDCFLMNREAAEKLRDALTEFLESHKNWT